MRVGVHIMKHFFVFFEEYKVQNSSIYLKSKSLVILYFTFEQFNASLHKEGIPQIIWLKSMGLVRFLFMYSRI